MPTKTKHLLWYRLTVLSILALVDHSIDVLGPSSRTQFVVSGLSSPTGIGAVGSGTLLFTQLPTPGVSGSQGGRNTVNEVKLASGEITVLTQGEPEPTNLAFSKGVL